jgi:hypothetical protein
MPAATYDITIEQGATLRLSFVWKDSEEVPINLTGYSARMQVRRSFSSTDKLLDLSTEDGSITLGGAAGTITVEGDASLTELLKTKCGVYDLELESSDGVVTRLIQGEVTVAPEVTRND